MGPVNRGAPRLLDTCSSHLLFWFADDGPGTSTAWRAFAGARRVRRVRKSQIPGRLTWGLSANVCRVVCARILSCLLVGSAVHAQSRLVWSPHET